MDIQLKPPENGNIEEMKTKMVKDSNNIKSSNTDPKADKTNKEKSNTEDSHHNEEEPECMDYSNEEIGCPGTTEERVMSNFTEVSEHPMKRSVVLY